MGRCNRLLTENRIGKTTYSKTRRTLRDKWRRTNGTARIPANKQLSPRRGRANTNSGPPLRASTMSMVIETSFAPARQWKNLRMGSARDSRVGVGVAPKQSFIPRDLIFSDAPRNVRDLEHAFASTRDACATLPARAREQRPRGSGRAVARSHLFPRPRRGLVRGIRRPCSPAPDRKAWWRPKYFRPT